MDRDEQYNSFIGPGWYTFVVVTGLSLIYHLNHNTQPAWLTPAYSFIWGAVAWGCMSFLVWSISEYFPGGTEGLEEAIEEEVRQITDRSPEQNSDEPLIEHMSKILKRDSIIIGRRTIMLNSEQRKQVQMYFFYRWNGATSSSAFGDAGLPPRVIETLMNNQYATSIGDGKYELTDRGKELFPCKNEQ